MGHYLLNILLLTALLPAQSNAQNEPLTVEAVATASEYVPISKTISHPGHAYTNCLGTTSYFASFHSYGDFGSISGTADTNTNCSTTFTPSRQTTLTSYHRVNYMIVKDDHALYLLSCTQTWKPSRAAHGLAALQGALRARSHQDQADTQEEQAKILTARGAWSECPAFVVSHKYALVINSASDVRIQNGSGDETQKSRKPVKLEYLGSAPLPLSGLPAAPLSEPQTANEATRAKADIPSSQQFKSVYDVRVDAPAEQVLAGLAERYDLKKDDTGSETLQDWVVTAKGDADSDWYELLIREGKVYAIMSHRGDYRSDDAAKLLSEVFNELYNHATVSPVQDKVSQLWGERNLNTSVTLQRFSVRDKDEQTIFIELGNNERLRLELVKYIGKPAEVSVVHIRGK
ncbi:MAG TPA: hypothetical protein VI636_18910 [Candidatus Angelobacter sp.]